MDIQIIFIKIVYGVNDISVLRIDHENPQRSCSNIQNHLQSTCGIRQQTIGTFETYHDGLNDFVLFKIENLYLTLESVGYTCILQVSPDKDEVLEKFNGLPRPGEVQKMGEQTTSTTLTVEELIQGLILLCISTSGPTLPNNQECNLL